MKTSSLNACTPRKRAGGSAGASVPARWPCCDCFELRGSASGTKLLKKSLAEPRGRAPVPRPPAVLTVPISSNLVSWTPLRAVPAAFSPLSASPPRKPVAAPPRSRPRALGAAGSVWGTADTWTEDTRQEARGGAAQESRDPAL